MKDLKCGLRACKHNRGYCCCADSIDVACNTDCATYEPDESKLASSFEAAQDFPKADYSVDTEVKCEAECLFNKSGKCVANGITVSSDPQSAASCLTFVKR